MKCKTNFAIALSLALSLLAALHAAAESLLGSVRLAFRDGKTVTEVMTTLLFELILKRGELFDAIGFHEGHGLKLVEIKCLGIGQVGDGAVGYLESLLLVGFGLRQLRFEVTNDGLLGLNLLRTRPGLTFPQFLS